MKPLYIFDLDGTLCNNDHRQHLVRNPGCDVCGVSMAYESNKPPCYRCANTGRPNGWSPDFDAFNELCHLDTPVPAVVGTLNALLTSGTEVWFVSGRMDKGQVAAKTRTWLLLNTDVYDDEVDNGQLFLRAEGDSRHDHIVKEEFLNNMLPEDRERLVAVFDDRSAVVAMWRRNGVPCFQVAPGNF